MELSKEIQEFLLKDAVGRFLRYVKIWTTSNETSESIPSSKGQIELGKILFNELKNLGLVNIIQDENGYIYANLQSSEGL